MSNDSRLQKSNCNTKYCKDCMFRPDGKGIELTEARIVEIKNYLTGLQCSHLCHVTNKTCYGGLVIQAEMLHRLGIIENNTVESFLNKAQEVLKFK